MKQKLFSILALLLVAVSGAWAQTEELLTTITATGDKQASYSMANVATVSFSCTQNGNLSYLANWGWWGYDMTLTVTAAEGYTITKCVFYDDANRTATDSEAPFVVETIGEQDKTPRINGTPIDGGNMQSKGIKKIEVYGYVTPTATGYSVTLKDGTEDAENWKAKVGNGELQALPLTGLTGDGTETVTITYTGDRKVKSVKAVKKEVVKPDLLPAVFTVDEGKTVKFSKGNLQATYNGSSWIWGFAEHQWDYIGNAAGNTSINGNGTVSANGTVDLFGWVGASSTWTGAAQYGISNSTATNNVDGYGNVGSEAQKVGWGATVGAGWRTLTMLEWLYLLNTRETGITVNSTNHARYTMAIINTDGTAVKGLIIFPDSYAGGSPAGVTWGTINAKSTFDTTCTSAGWTALEAAGCVFLPAAGYREASNVTDAGIGGGYWSSSSGYAASAVGPYFESDWMTIQYVSSRKYGYSVRLVRDAD